MAAKKVERGLFATTSTFTDDAVAFAKENGVDFLDVNRLLEMIAKRPPEDRPKLLDEPPWVCRRLHFLRGWSHDEDKPQVFPGGPGAVGTDGSVAPERASVAVGGDRIGGRQDRLLGANAVQLGAAG